MSATTTLAPVGSRKWLDEVGGCATRAARKAQFDLASADERIFSLEADLRDCGGDEFREAFPGRSVDVGIAEANLIGMAAGLAMRGKLPFVNTFASFALMRACEQVRLDLCYHKANVKIAGIFAGMAAGASGPTHQCIEDVAVARSFPNMVVLVPADAVDAYHATVAASRHDGPVYIRLGVEPTPAVYGEGHTFQIGRGRVLLRGERVGIVAAGLSSVANALAAGRLLSERGVRATIVDMSTIKPLDEALLAGVAAETGCLVTVEEHSVLGGLGGAVAEFVAGAVPVPVHRIGLADEYCRHVGPYAAQLKRCGLDAQAIADRTLTVLERKW
jgi:transketolase